MSHNVTPPKVAEWLMKWFYPDNGRYTTLGDLEEVFASIYISEGRFRAICWYWWQTLIAVPPSFFYLFIWSLTMLKNYFRISLRNLKNNKVYSFINISGLALGLASAVLIMLYVIDAFSFDMFNEKIDRLYRVCEDQVYSDYVYKVHVTPYPLGPALIEEIPEIEDALRQSRIGTMLVKHEDKMFFEMGITAVDESFFSMLSYKMLKGNPENAFPTVSSVAISQEIAEKYFGDDDPINKVLSLNNKYDFTVSAVLENCPENSTIYYEILVPFEFLKTIGQYNEGFGSNSIATYVLLREGTTKAAVDQKIKGFIKARVEGSVTDLYVKPLEEMALNSAFYGKPYGNILFIYVFSAIALFVLLIACINFMNLSTARSAKRAREVGMRKVVGAHKKHLIIQFYGESMLLSIIALVFSIALVWIAIPYFNILFDAKISLNTNLSQLVIGLIGVTLFTGLVAGSYPALYLSSFMPLKVLKGGQLSGKKGSKFRRVMVVIQFSLSIFLIVGTVVIYQQMLHMQTMNLGFDKEHLLYLPLRGETRDNFQVLKEKLLSKPLIENVAGAGNSPTGIGSNTSGIGWDGKDENQTELISFGGVEYDFIETMGIQLADGRGHSVEFPADTMSVLINEAFANMIGGNRVVGQMLSWGGDPMQIIGVMKNYNFQQVQSKIEPLALYLSETTRVMIVRTSVGNVTDAVSQIKDSWEEVNSDFPFEYTFVDEDFDRMFSIENAVGGGVRVFTIMAIIIACLGLFGLASFTAEQRTKEIGVRKVLGASEPSIMVLLCKEFVKLVLISNVIAAPFAYFTLSRMLEMYANRMELSAMIFIVTGLAALVIALLTVAYQAVRAAYSNPVDALKYE